MDRVTFHLRSRRRDRRKRLSASRSRRHRSRRRPPGLPRRRHNVHWRNRRSIRSRDRQFLPRSRQPRDNPQTRARWDGRTCLEATRLRCCAVLVAQHSGHWGRDDDLLLALVSQEARLIECWLRNHRVVDVSASYALVIDDYVSDASEIECAVHNGEVTLTGTVSARETKRPAEDLVESVSGVKEVQNSLKVKKARRTPTAANPCRASNPRRTRARLRPPARQREAAPRRTARRRLATSRPIHLDEDGSAAP